MEIGSHTNALRPLSATTRKLPPKERLEFLNDVYARERLVIAPRPDLSAPIDAGSRLWQLDSIGYATTFSSGHIGKRLSAGGTAMLAVRKHHTNGCHSWSEEGYFRTQPGDFLITLNTEQGVHSCIGLQSTNIAIPVDLISLDWKRFQKTQILRVGTLGNRLLSVALDDWTRRLEQLPSKNVLALEGEILSLVSHVLTNNLHEDDGGLVAQTRGAAMRKYVRENLSETPVSVDQLCRVFGTSRASVFREFAEDGGVRRYANAYRLRKAMLKLGDREPTRGAVGQVAAEMGFNDPLAFSKAFRREFGFSPSDALRLTA